jgi:hypothetical protein
VDLPESERDVGLAKKGQADGAEGSAPELDGTLDGGREWLFEGNCAAASTACADGAGTEFVVDVGDVVEEAAAFEAEPDQQAIDLRDTTAETVFGGEQAANSGVRAARRAAADGNEVATVDMEDVGRIGHG